MRTILLRLSTVTAEVAVRYELVRAPVPLDQPHTGAAGLGGSRSGLRVRVTVTSPLAQPDLGYSKNLTSFDNQPQRDRDTGKRRRRTTEAGRDHDSELERQRTPQPGGRLPGHKIMPARSGLLVGQSPGA